MLRVNDLAAELGISSDEVISLMRGMEIPVRSHLTPVADDQATRVRVRWERELGLRAQNVLLRGKVKSWSDVKGYGFIATKAEDVFVHYSAIEMQGFKTLEVGQIVEVEIERGLKGTQATNVRVVGDSSVQYRSKVPKPMPIHGARSLSVFLCHSSRDKDAVRELYRDLARLPFVSPWLDERNLLPGQDWNLEITRAVREADCVIVCLSKGAINRAGYVQKELAFALDVAQEKPEGAIYLIPLRLDDCPPPIRIARWQYVDLFQADGFERLTMALHQRALDLGVLDTP